MIQVLKYNTTELRALINPDASSGETRGIMADHVFDLKFTSPVFIDFQIGDYANIWGVIFRLNKDAEFTKVAKRQYDFALRLEGPTLELRRAQYLTLNANNFFTEGKFKLRATPLTFCQLLISNMNRAFPGLGWELGQVIEGDFKDFEFNGNSCLQALNMAADIYQTEFLIDGRKLHFAKRQPASPLVLEYGSKKPLFMIGRKNQDSADIITRLYAYGSDKNLGNNYRLGAPRLRMKDSLYIEKNVTRFGLYEATVVFDDIYPRRTGLVTSVDTPFVFADADIDFDVNDHLIAGTTAKLTFNTGLLAGVTFEINSFNNSTQKFTINASTADQTVTMPSADFTPAIGDSYVLTDITQPIQYIEAAEEELRIRAVQYLEENGMNKLAFPVGCNQFYFKSTGSTIELGSVVRLLGAEMNIDRQIRIYSYTRNYRNPDLYTIELADTAKAQPILLQILNQS